MTNFVFVFVLLALAAADEPEQVTDEESRVVGGMPAEAGQFPYQVSLRVAKNMGHFCGGSVIDNRWIVTAAHCAIAFNTTDIKAVTGSVKLDEGGQVYDIDKIIIHESYKGSSTLYDIALMKTASDVQFDNYTKPVSLPDAPLKANEDVVLSGWGKTSHPGSVPNNLMYADLKTISNTKCRVYHLLNNVSDENVCTLTRVGQGACMGDSGGPLVHKDQLGGIVSWGTACARGRPDVFTRVYSYMKWIQSHRKDNAL